MLKSKSWTGGPEEEYETQHFGYGKQRLQLALRDMVEGNIIDTTRELETYIENTLKPNETDKNRIKTACETLISLYCKRSEPILENIDREIERTVSIPAHILLPEDEQQMTQLSDSDMEKLKQEVAASKRRVERAAIMEQLLLAEEEELKSTEKTCQVTTQTMKAIDSWVNSLSEQAEMLKVIERDAKVLCSSTPFIKANDDIEAFGEGY